MILAVGDEIEFRRDGQARVIRRILTVRVTGYDWVYPAAPNKVFRSEDSSGETGNA